MPTKSRYQLTADKYPPLAMEYFCVIENQSIYLSRRMIGKGFYELNHYEKEQLAKYIVNCPTEDLTIKPVCHFLNMGLASVIYHVAGKELEDLPLGECVNLMNDIVIIAGISKGITERELCLLEEPCGHC